MTIGYNKSQFFGKVVFLTVVLSFVAWFLYYRPPIRFDHASIAGIFLGVLIGSLLAFLLVLMTLQLFFLPTGVDIDEANNLLTLKFIFGRQAVLHSSDLLKFFSIAVSTKSSRYEGILLKTTGKDYILGDFNLEDFTPIKTFLEKSNIEFAGKQKFSFVSYFINFFRQ